MKKRGVVGISKKALLCIMAVLLLVTVTAVLSACAGSGIDISKDVDDKATFPEFTRDPDDTYEWEESTEPPTETETEPETEEPVELIGLREAFANYFYIGVALPNNVLQNWVRYKDVILKNFNSITCENEMKPDFMLSQSESRKNLDVTYTDPVVHFSSPQLAVKYATQNNIKMRLHTLVWHAQTPK
ncbi:MAG TPA: endo-1,4-beta-xylanase, partial [Bacillota bacterium]|nr:endo-1,4-beta-xylanase [Bacillota bacterium]